MEVELKIDENCEAPKVVIYTRSVTPQITALVNQLSGDAPKRVAAFRGEEIFLVEPEDIFTIYTEGQKVFVGLSAEVYRLKNRLYELEELFTGTSFLRISNSEIVNFSKVESLDLSISGTITLRLKNGKTSFVSRRYMDKIKKYLGL